MDLMTPATRDRRIAVLLEAAEILRAMPVTTPCAACGFFSSEDGLCDRWKQVVPEHARGAGCDSWSEGLPF
jgi:hypothetical protein